MAATKIRDLAVRVSEYTDGQGQTKGRYENVGSMMKGEDGGVFLIFKRTFNPAGVPNPEGRDSLMISCFELKDQNQQGQQHQRPQQQPQNFQQPPAYDNSDVPL
ncbi:MAG: hypothetical protein CL583_01945 [Alteromonadaceae bacterium]|nr:hypothetical protein [Alteromonadaceae bacterium]|tara:strand:- start:352 stop:663 length:312 start_codon:yes stop_codon:yes gene_type:complete